MEKKTSSTIVNASQNSNLTFGHCSFSTFETGNAKQKLDVGTPLVCSIDNRLMLRFARSCCVKARIKVHYICVGQILFWGTNNVADLQKVVLACYASQFQQLKLSTADATLKWIMLVRYCTRLNTILKCRSSHRSVDTHLFLLAISFKAQEFAHHNHDLFKGLVTKVMQQYSSTKWKMDSQSGQSNGVVLNCLLE